ncbi:transposase [Paenibacillus lautus]|nr:transposase [Paenibacillus lautus]MEC0254497.1 transposase [Paenibacillus lautus]
MISNESGVTAFELAERGTVVFVAGRREQEAKTVLFATEGKGMDTLERFKEHLSTKGASAEQIEDVCCDMSPAFYPWNPGLLSPSGNHL